jgi:hypothetical protein
VTGSSITTTCSTLGQSCASSSASGTKVGGHGQQDVLGFVDHRGQLGGRKPGVERVADEAHAHRRVIHLEVMLAVPGQRADPLAGFQSQRRQRARHAVGALADLGIACAHPAPARRRLDDAAGAGPGWPRDPGIYRL